MLISVLGTGYLGATLAACLAHLGHDVVGVDTDPGRVAVLSTGRAPFHEPGLDELLADGHAAGRLVFTSDVAAAARAEVHFLCVGTPQLDDGRPDLRALDAVVDRLAPLLEGPCAVVGRSTVPAGTTARVRQRVHALAPAGTDVAVAWQPEFLREGHAVADTLRPDRIVLGVDDTSAALDALTAVWARLLEDGVPVLVTDTTSAELAKTAANSLLALRISMTNLLAELCEGCGGDIRDLTAILAADPRIGPHLLGAGLGYGGGCLPKDLRALVERCREVGLDGPADLLRAADAVNRHQRDRVVEAARGLLPPGSSSAPRVACLGAAFKPGTDDLRDSPALEVIDRLVGAGCDVVAHDPEAGQVLAARRPDLAVHDDPLDACRGADLVVLLTDWPQYAALCPVALREVVARPVVLDARVALDRDRWQAAGWAVRTTGIDLDRPVDRPVDASGDASAAGTGRERVA